MEDLLKSPMEGGDGCRGVGEESDAKGAEGNGDAVEKGEGYANQVSIDEVGATEHCEEEQRKQAEEEEEERREKEEEDDEGEWIDEELEDFMDFDDEMVDELGHGGILLAESFRLTSWISPPSASLVERMKDLILVELVLHSALDLVWRFFNRRDVLYLPSFFTSPHGPVGRAPSTRTLSVSTPQAAPPSPYSPLLSSSGSSFRLSRTNSVLNPFGAA